VLVELELRVVGSHREVVVRGLIGEMMVCMLVRGLVGLGFRGDDHSFGFQRNYEPRFPPHGARTSSMGHGKFSCKGMMFANPSFEQMARHWFNFLCANPSVESLAHSRSCF
jgi:hypothetical protein